MADIGGGKGGGVRRKAKMIPQITSLPKNNKSGPNAASVRVVTDGRALAE